MLVLVKAAPVLTQHFDETMCVAGVRLDRALPEWVRLHPVPFRDLGEDSQFAKYQEIEVEAIKPKTDRRPESWTPLHGSIRLGERIGVDRKWADRRDVIARLPEQDMCDLVEANRRGSGPGTPSLAIVRPRQPPELAITERDAEQLARWRSRAQGAASRQSLFDDASTAKPDFEVVPWRFQYRYRCAKPDCGAHTQTIVDWEAVALWRHVRHRPNWQELVRQKFEAELWRDRAAVLFVGNQEQHPTSFLVLGVFWPPAGDYQPRLEL